MKISTVWEVRDYDVWGNARDGWEVNDSFSRGEVELDLPVKIYNQGKPGEFLGADVSEAQIRELFGRNANSDGQGDDLHIYVETKSGKPLGEMYCISHKSLSPISQRQYNEKGR